MRTSSQKPGKSSIAYRLQPQAQKWTCALCGRRPVDKRDEETGQPKFTVESFPNRFEYKRHLRLIHLST